MKKLTQLIVKNPVKTLLFTFAIVIALTIGATQITLNTGNDTLISNTSDIYLENEAYQMEFGRDPIILIFDDETAFDPETLTLMNLLQEEVKDLDGIFSINSPVTVMNQMSVKLYEQTNLGLTSMATGLTEISNQLATLSANLVSGDSNLPDLDALQTNIGQLVDAQDNLGSGLVNMFNVLGMLDMSLDALKTDLVDLRAELDGNPAQVDALAMTDDLQLRANGLSTNVKQLILGDNIKTIPHQTSAALGQLLTTLSTLSTTLTDQLDAMTQLSGMLSTLGTNIGAMGANLDQMQRNFNAFAPSFPTSSETIEMMIYDEGVLRESYKGFLIGDTKLRMVIVLNGDATDAEIDLIGDKLETVLKTEGKTEQVLVSGKPILDRSIKSSMMDSMQLMMMSAVVIMILVLALIYKVRMRLLPIFMILIAVGVTVGLMGWLSIGLTMVSMAVFPVLIGLGIDYFIQFQTRYEEERAK